MKEQKRILTADIGGTKTLVAMAVADQGKITIENKKRYDNAAYSHFSELFQDYLKDSQSCDLAVFGVAGTVNNHKAHLTNLGWNLDEKTISEELRLPRVRLINDLAAFAYATRFLEEKELVILQKGEPTDGPRAVIAAGTGLGEALSYNNRVLPGEGGHAGFSPANRLESQLWEYILNTDPFACNESLLSGKGLVSIYRFLSENKDPAGILSSGDPAAKIALLANENETCRQSMEVFTGIYGGEAGNLAVRTLPFGGLFIGGGIAPKMLEWLQKPVFMERFLAKGKMQNVLKKIPVYVSTLEDAPLIGAAACCL